MVSGTEDRLNPDTSFVSKTACLRVSRTTSRTLVGFDVQYRPSVRLFPFVYFTYQTR